MEPSQPDAGQCFGPPDLDEYLRHQVGVYRGNQFLLEFNAQLVTQFFPAVVSDGRELIEKIAASINVPPFGEAWDSQINLEAMMLAVKFTEAEATAQAALDVFHYSEIAGDVKIGGPIYAETTWDTYIKALGVVRVLSRAFWIAIQKEVTGGGSSSALEKVVLVNRIHLVELISKTKALGTNESIGAVQALTFDGRLSHLELWDTPLIPVDADLVLFVPSIIGTGNPVRAIENIIAQWNDQLFTERGRILERRIKTIFSSVSGAQVQGPVVFRKQDGTEVQCDLVICWGGHLILIEAKCTKDIYSAANSYRARSRLDDAIEQLNVRLEAVTVCWAEFKDAASRLHLPSNPPPREKIELIATTNVTQFTGQFREKVMIVDEHIIARFFGPKDISVTDGFQQLGVVDHIRKSDDTRVEEFLSYIADPPQIRMVRDRVKLETAWMPGIKDTDPAIGFIKTSYVPMEIPTAMAAQTKTTKRRTKVPRNAPCPCGSGRKYKRCCGRTSLRRGP